MMAARKWDRLETACEEAGYDIFKLLADDNREESVLDDIRDLRAYLLLIETFIQDINNFHNYNTPNQQPVDTEADAISIPRCDLERLLEAYVEFREELVYMDGGKTRIAVQSAYKPFKKFLDIMDRYLREYVKKKPLDLRSDADPKDISKRTEKLPTVPPPRRPMQNRSLSRDDDPVHECFLSPSEVAALAYLNSLQEIAKVFREFKEEIKYDTWQDGIHVYADVPDALSVTVPLQEFFTKIDAELAGHIAGS